MSKSKSPTENISGGAPIYYAMGNVGSIIKKCGRACIELIKQDHKARRYRSRLWFLLPLFGNVVGGLIAYFAIRHDDPDKAKNCLLVGLLLLAPGVIMLGVAAAIRASVID